MNDFEKVIKDLKMLKDNAHEFYSRNISDYSIPYTILMKILQNAIDLLKEYNNDRG